MWFKKEKPSKNIVKDVSGIAKAGTLTAIMVMKSFGNNEGPIKSVFYFSRAQVEPEKQRC
jgi:hypothetical protein